MPIYIYNIGRRITFTQVLDVLTLNSFFKNLWNLIADSKARPTDSISVLFYQALDIFSSL
jgi:hypothetical protein